MINQRAVCSWSLRPRSVTHLAELLDACAIRRTQIALGPLIDDPRQRDALGDLIDAGHLQVCSGMMQTIGEDYSTLESIRATGGLRPDGHWEANLGIARRCAALAADLGLALVTLHAGFIPERDGSERRRILERIRRVAEVFNEQGVTLGLETGQETAETLLGVLSAVASAADVGVNFDPANMILYAMGDPIEAMERLRAHIVQVHMKDAVSTRTPGTWGTEVVAGAGEVDWDAFFDIVQAIERPIDVVIEREAGDERVADVRTAARIAQRQIERVQS